jgi:hypothetical protein
MRLLPTLERSSLPTILHIQALISLSFNASATCDDEEEEEEDEFLGFVPLEFRIDEEDTRFMMLDDDDAPSSFIVLKPPRARRVGLFEGLEPAEVAKEEEEEEEDAAATAVSLEPTSGFN